MNWRYYFMLTSEDYVDQQEIDSLMQSITEDELRRLSRERLIQINREKKALDMKARQILISLSDSEKRDRIFSIVEKMHKAILDNDMEFLELLKSELSEEDVEFYTKHKHDGFFRSAEVFDKFLKHPVQKTMLKAKCISKRKVKKNKTANQHMEYMILSKEVHNLKIRQDVLEKQQIALDRKFLELERNLVDMRTNQSFLFSVTATLHDKLNYLLSCGESKDKVAAYSLKQENPSLTQSEIATMFGVSRETVNRWFKSVEKKVLELDTV